MTAVKDIVDYETMAKILKLPETWKSQNVEVTVVPIKNNIKAQELKDYCGKLNLDIDLDNLRGRN